MVIDKHIITTLNFLLIEVVVARIILVVKGILDDDVIAIVGINVVFVVLLGKIVVEKEVVVLLVEVCVIKLEAWDIEEVDDDKIVVGYVLVIIGDDVTVKI